MTTNSYDLQRFVIAQSQVWDDVCAELRAGLKQSHWMWFVFPQLSALGRSATAKFYGLSGAEEAKAYLADSVLGTRLRSCCEVLLKHDRKTAVEILGATDAMKLRSCLTLFAAVGPRETVFQKCLLRYFDGMADAATLALLPE
jgi:uncharacterized protein (DUF1810 family)